MAVNVIRTLELCPPGVLYLRWSCQILQCDILFLCPLPLVCRDPVPDTIRWSLPFISRMYRFNYFMRWLRASTFCKW
jgi:hypothetical protein